MSTLMDILRFGSPESIVLYFGIAFIVFVYKAFFSEREVVRRKLRKAVRKYIGDVKSGEVVKIVGEVVYAGRTVKAGLSERECSFYHIEVEYYRPSGKTGSWIRMIDEKKRGDIVLRDETGYALIQDDRAQSVLHRDIEYTSGSFDHPLPEMEAFLKKHKKDDKTWLGFNRSMRYYEGVLEAGELCAASGKGVWMPTRKLNLNLPVDKVLVIRRAPQVETRISDHPEALEKPWFL